MTMAAKGLAKLIEELGELSQIAGKRLAYYTTDVHPDGAGSLQRRMADEMADVRAAMDFVAQQFGIDTDYVSDRAARKFALFQSWHAAEGNNAHAIDAALEARPGCVVVPEELTVEMLRAISAEFGGGEVMLLRDTALWRRIYRAALEAAPKASAPPADPAPPVAAQRFKALVVGIEALMKENDDGHWIYFADHDRRIADHARIVAEKDAEIRRLSAMLVDCYTFAGDDTTHASPASMAERAVAAVTQLRLDYDEALTLLPALTGQSTPEQSASSPANTSLAWALRTMDAYHFTRDEKNLREYRDAAVDFIDKHGHALAALLTGQATPEGA